MYCQADDMATAATDMCENVKACSLAQIEEEDMTPEMRQMMEPMLQNMCANMRRGVQNVDQGHPLYESAVKCMRSMAELTCDQIQDQSFVETPACQEYQAKAGSYYKN